MTIQEYLDKGISSFHAVKISKNILEKAGYAELAIDDNWNLEQGKGYFISPYPSSLYAFYIGNNNVRMIAGHTDYPVLKLKPAPSINRQKNIVANVESYGGMILNTWFDRPLGLAGKVICKGSDPFNPIVHLYDSKTPLAVIPSLAIHMNRDVNKKNELNVQEHLLPLIAMGDEDNTDVLIKYIANDLGIDIEEILDFDLVFYNMDKPTIIGLNQEFLVSPRLDNLTSCYCCVEAMSKKNGGSTAVMALFDNEEIGSRTKQGADSTLLKMIIEKLLKNHPINAENDVLTMESLVNKGFFVSLDVAHAYHPNYSSKSDITTKTIMGNGVVLKISGSQRYNSDSYSNGVVKGLCKESNIPLQMQINNSNIAGGTTLGPIVSSYLPVYGTDMGVAVLAMHSACETCALKDIESLGEFTKVFIQ